MNGRMVRLLVGTGLMGICLALVTLLTSAELTVTAAQGPSSRRASGPTDQTSTRLPDGRWLFVGGKGSETSASTWDPQTDRVTPLSGLLAPRAGHTATLLADGRVLLLGGNSAAGLVELPEVFDPEANAFTALSIVGATARTGHSATLLTDGRVAVLGGTNGTDAPLPTEVWDVRRQQAAALPAVALDRRDHTATLRADGGVEITGGRVAGGARTEAVMVFDPRSRSLGNAAPRTAAPDAARVTSWTAFRPPTRPTCRSSRR